MRTFACSFIILLYGFVGISKPVIGIIGAGNTGLVAALELQKKGYHEVVLLEKEDRVGGKVMTYFHDGLPYELGAVITAPDYEIILGLANDLGLELSPTPKSITLDESGHAQPMLAWSSEKYGWLRLPKLVKDFGKFSYYVVNHRDFFEPGFSHTPLEMHQSFEDFAKQIGIAAVLEAFRPVMVGCGYGYAESMPAAYWMKLMKTFGHEYTMHACSFAPFYQSFSDGWQTLWETLVAKHQLDVRRNTSVIRIERDAASHKIKVITTNGIFVFDKLINTIPHVTTDLMDVNAEEREIFSEVRTIPYKVTLAEIDGLPQRAHLWLRKNSYQQNEDGSPNDGKPVLISSNQNTNIYQIYQFSEQAKDDHMLKQLLDDTVKEIGGKLKRTLKEATFTYFPHFTAESFKRNMPERLENLQGIGGIYYTGALLNFETVELSAAHAKQLIQKFF